MRARGGAAFIAAHLPPACEVTGPAGAVRNGLEFNTPILSKYSKTSIIQLMKPEPRKLPEGAGAALDLSLTRTGLRPVLACISPETGCFGP